MKRTDLLRLTTAAITCSLLLTACGKSGVVNVSDKQIGDFKAAYTAGVDGTAKPAVIGAAETQDLYDPAFLDSGFTKTDIIAALTGEATALPNATTTGHSGVPQVTLSNVVVSNCNNAGPGPITCSLSASVTNSDVDTTVASLSANLRLSPDGKLRLVGDNISTTP